jgi:hypothetical protein
MILDKGKTVLSSPNSPEQLCGPPSSLFDGTRALTLMLKMGGFVLPLPYMPSRRAQGLCLYIGHIFLTIHTGEVNDGTLKN